MTQDDIIRMAREAGGFDATPEFLERFAELVRADERERAQRENAYVALEREACAQTCEQAGIDGYGTLAAAALIRKRSEA